MLSLKMLLKLLHRFEQFSNVSSAKCRIAGIVKTLISATQLLNIRNVILVFYQKYVCKHKKIIRGFDIILRWLIRLIKSNC